MNPTDQIAAEAWNEIVCAALGGSILNLRTGQGVSIIKSAIESYVHASEQGYTTIAPEPKYDPMIDECEQGDCECDKIRPIRKPDSAATPTVVASKAGKDEDLDWLAVNCCQSVHDSATNAQACEAIKAHIREYLAATPSGGAEWAVKMDDFGDGWIEAKHPIEIHSFKADAQEVAYAHNASIKK